MSVRFLTSWNGYSAGDRATLANEPTLIAAGIARADYVQDGRSPLFPPNANYAAAVVGAGGVSSHIRSDFLRETSTLEFLYGDPAQTWGLTNATVAISKDYRRYHNHTLAVTPSTASGVILKSNRTIQSPDSRVLSIDIYIPFQIRAGAGAPAINVSMSNNNNLATSKTVFTFNANYLRQGWNSLRMYQYDTESMAARGTVKTDTSGGVDFATNIQYIEIQLQNMSGLTVYLDSVRRAAMPAKTAIVIGFDASGTDILSAARLFSSYGFGGYYTVTNIYDLGEETLTAAANRRVLTEQYGWDALPHTWNHGGTVAGAEKAITSLSRTSNVVTATYTEAHEYATGLRFYSNIRGASPSDMAGVYEMTVTGASTVTYTATGANGSATGTITSSTFLGDVINADTTELEGICRHEIADNIRTVRSSGYSRNYQIMAYPNNSVPFLPVLERIASESGLVLGRSIAGGTVKINEFGVDNPLHFGSYELGSSGEALVVTQALINKITGAILRGEDFWFYGHYVLDETLPENVDHAAADMTYSPGNNGNPLPPGSVEPDAAGGWIYVGQLRRIIEATLPYVDAGTVEWMTPTEWARRRGYAV
jgi:hypothetical protein